MTLTSDEYARDLFNQGLLKQWGPDKDIDAAIPLYRASANLGFAGAQNNLGDLYEHGTCVPQSDLAAMFWYTRAAERGEPTAFLSLANMLNRTQADEATLTEALKFAALARLFLQDGGNKDLAKVLEGLIADKLSPEGRQKAYEMASTWEPLYQEEFLLSDSPAFTPQNATVLEEPSDMVKLSMPRHKQSEETFTALWSFCTENDRVVPKQWDKLYKRLANKRQLPSGAWEPALPLILAAWHETSSIEKQARFKEHLEWALAQGQIEQISIYLRSLGEDGWYHFDEL